MGSEPRITKQELRDLATRVDMLWDERAAAFDPFAVRVRALAEAADEVAPVVGLAELSGIRTPRPEARFGVETLLPKAVREGPADLWHEFDLRAQAAEQAAATTSTAGMLMAFEALRSAANVAQHSELSKAWQMPYLHAIC